MGYLEDLKKLFNSTFSEEVSEVENIGGDGSHRKIIRLKGQTKTVIGVWGPDKKENRAFVELSRYFYSKNLPVPQIYAFDEKKQIYLETDLGNTTLFSYLKEKRKNEYYPDDVIDYYRKSLEYLAAFQTETIDNFDSAYFYPRKEFDEQSMMWDLNYFKYYFLKLASIEFDEQKLENDYLKFVSFLSTAPRNFFMYRDFQSRNIMIKDGDTYFIDYQGGRKGPLCYDAASLLFDAKADLPYEIRIELLNYYLGLDRIRKVINREEFMKYFYGFVYIRLMQAMGAYGLRGFYEKKPHFLTSIPYVIKNIEWLLANVELPVKLPELTKVFKRITTSSYLRQFAESNLGLNLRIYSFSYKDGIPQDPEGHNGGFVFDCRSLINPGRDPLYFNFTGKDIKVVEFLDKDESVNFFFERCYELVNYAVKNYLSRNFTELYVAFGCTGGQHRSVYMAERLYKKFLNVKNVIPHIRHLALEKKVTEKV